MIGITPPHPFATRKLPDRPQPHQDDLRVLWGGRPTGMPLGMLGTHFLVMGATGSGKTNIIKMLMNSLLPDGDGELRYRSVIYDPKRELIPFLSRVNIPDDRVIITNPYDARCSAWDMAADVREPGDAETIARAIIPLPEDSDRRDENAFFTNAANQTLTAMIEALATAAPKKWDFRDVVEACARPSALKQLLRVTLSGRDILASYYKPYDKTAKNVFSTVQTYIGQFRVLASLWHNASTKFSMDDWLDNRAVIVLGTRPRRASVVELANRLIMNRAIEVVIDQNDDKPQDLSWFFLDELREAGRFSKLNLLMNQGRSKGAHVVVGYQDQSGMNDLMGDDAANEIASQCSNKALLHLASGISMEWASKQCAQSKQRRPSHTTTERGESSTTVTEDFMDVVPPIRFRELRLAQNHRGATEAIFVQAGLRTFHGEMSAREVDAAMPPKMDKDDLPPDLIERPSEHQLRVPWSQDDYARLGLTPNREGDSDESETDDDTTRTHRAPRAGAPIRTMPWHQ
ncbi:MAG: type IV secretion system DNA-binding domain-containing protein [Phycisphaerales bacterium]